MPKTYTVKQVADALGFSTNTVYKYLEEGKIKAARLGKEGRFKIPESEYARLTGRHLTGTGEQVLEKGGIYNPDLMEWFLGLAGIFVGVAYFLFPLEYRFVSIEPWRYWLVIAGVASLGGGIAVVAVDMFWAESKKLTFWSHALLAIGFGILTNAFRLMGNWTSMVWFVGLTMSVVLACRKSWEYLRFMGLVWWILAVGGLVWAFHPEPGFLAGVQIYQFALYNPWTFWAIWASMGTALIVGNLTNHNTRFPAKYIAGLLLAGVFFGIAVLYVVNLEWGRAVVAMLIAVFAGLFMFVGGTDKRLDLTRKQATTSFGWMGLVLILGLVVIHFSQTQFKKFLLEEGNRKVEMAVSLIDTYVSTAAKRAMEFAQSSDLADLVTGRNSLALDVKTKEMYNVAVTMRRVLVIDKNGETLSLYPPIDGRTRGGFANVADREYFIQAKAGRKIIVSEAIKPRFITLSTAVYVGSPIQDRNGNFLGMVLGALDLQELTAQLKSVEGGSTGFVSAADRNGTIFLHRDPAYLGQQVKLSQSMLDAIGGKSGQREGYAESGELMLQSYAPVKSLGWGIVVNQLYSAAFSDSFLTTFTIFLMTVLAGVGTLLVTTSSKWKWRL